MADLHYHALIQEDAILRVYPAGIARVELTGPMDTIGPSDPTWSRADGFRIAAVLPVQVPDGKLRRAIDLTGVQLVDGNPVWILDDAPAASQVALLAHAASVRYAREQGGMLWNGWPVATDDRSQGKINSEVLAVQMEERANGDLWKFADEVFRPLANSEILDLGRSARQHVKKCFAVEGIVASRIVGGVIQSFDAIDSYFAAAFASPG